MAILSWCGLLTLLSMLPAEAPTEPFLPPAEAQAMQAALRHHLDAQILPFWTSPNLEDPSRGGFLPYRDGQLKPFRKNRKPLILHLRMMYHLGIAEQRTDDPVRRKALRLRFDRHLRYLTERFWDQERGGWYQDLNIQGQPLDPDEKVAVGQAYAIYILAELADRLDDPRLAALAEQSFAWMDRGHDPEHGGYFEYPAQPAEAEANAGKLLGTNMHVALALARLIEVAPKPLYRQRLEELLTIFLRSTTVPESGNGYFILSRDWQPLTTPGEMHQRTLYGHNAELVWYTLDVTEALGRDPRELRPWAETLTQGFVRHGLDETGAIHVFGPLVGPADPMNTSRWWAQTEAMILFLRMYELTGDPAHWQHFKQVAGWTLAHYVTEDQPGCWQSEVDLSGQPTGGYRAGVGWKSDFHVVRMLLEVEATLDRLLQRQQPVSQ